jgi:hypothetical protein
MDFKLLSVPTSDSINTAYRYGLLGDISLIPDCLDDARKRRLEEASHVGPGDESISIMKWWLYDGIDLPG